MAFKTAQLTLTANTPQAAIVQGSGNNQFKNVKGTVQDPIPVTIMATVSGVTLGGSNALGTAADPGFPLIANVPFTMNIYGESEIPWVLSAGTPTVYVMLGRQ